MPTLSLTLFKTIFWDVASRPFPQYPWACALGKLQAPQAGGTSDCHVSHRQLLAGT